eukprot:1140949-Pelagomonas_calceolata.AAC.4
MEGFKTQKGQNICHRERHHRQRPHREQIEGAYGRAWRSLKQERARTHVTERHLRQRLRPHGVAPKVSLMQWFLVPHVWECLHAP